MSVSKEDIISSIEKMSISEVMELVSSIEEKFDISASSLTVSGGAGGDVQQEAVKDSFTIKLVGIGDSKINVIKVVRNILQLGLKEAKELVDKTPSIIKENIKKQEVEEIEKQLAEVGAKVEVS